MQLQPYSTADWAAVPLHPSPSQRSAREIQNWVFFVSVLNFSFWSDRPQEERYAVTYRDGVDGKQSSEASDKIWTGYWSLLAALHRAQDAGLPVTDATWYANATESDIRNLFQPSSVGTGEPGRETIALLDARVHVLREAGTGLVKDFGGDFSNVISLAGGSALKLVELVVKYFPAFDDKSKYAGREVHIRKRAQILVAELWAAFGGEGPGEFHDIDKLTMFADYRVPQILHSLGTLVYSPHLEQLLREHALIENGAPEEVELRCGSIVAVNEILQAIKRAQPDVRLNAVLLDFYLWDLAKKEESEGRPQLPHHRTRSIYY